MDTGFYQKVSDFYIPPHNEVNDKLEEEENVIQDNENLDELSKKSNESLRYFAKAVTKTQLPDSRPWYQEKYLPSMEQMAEYLTDINTILEYEDIELDRDTIIYCHKILYCFMLNVLMLFSDSLMDAEYGNDNGFITKIYITCCALMLRLDIPEYLKKSTKKLKYCIDNDLCVSDTEIQSYNIEELLCSINVLEQKWKNLGYTKELCKYIDALEWRIAELLTSAYQNVIHNVAEERCEYEVDEEDPKKTLYTCSPDCEYKLCINIASFRMELTSSILDWRREDLSPLGEPVPDEDIDNLINNLTHEIHDLYTDKLNDQFRNQYYYMATSTALKYQFLKKHPEQTEVNPSDAYVELKTTEELTRVRELANLPVVNTFVKLQDKTSVMLAMHLIMEETVEKYLGVKWSKYVVPQHILMNLNQIDGDVVLLSSMKSPMLTYSMNEACIIWKKQIYVFGCSPKDCLRALYYWIRFVCTGSSKDIFGSVINTDLFENRLLGENFTRKEIIEIIDRRYVESLQEKLKKVTLAEMMNTENSNEVSVSKKSGSAWKRKRRSKAKKRKIRNRRRRRRK